MPYHSFTIPKTARYFTAGPAPENAKGVLIALHGYGQLPEFFLRRFAPLAEAGWAIIAPEGLHRFYLEGTKGRVGASWMTKEAREDDIRDYVDYLDALAEHVGLAEYDPVLLGFSQGVATASRWLAMGRTKFSRLVLWAGVFPPDYPWEVGCEALQRLRVDVALGTEDPFFDDELLRTTASILDAKQVAYTTHTFPGGHAVDASLLARLLD